jgi:hypothetical protein
MLTNILRTWQQPFLYVISMQFLIKNYTEIFHVVYKENLPSFQCKKSLDWSASIGEVNALSLILIDLHSSQHPVLKYPQSESQKWLPSPLPVRVSQTARTCSPCRSIDLHHTQLSLSVIRIEFLQRNSLYSTVLLLTRRYHVADRASKQHVLHRTVHW